MYCFLQRLQCPGFILTDMTKGMANPPSKTPEQGADTAVWLVRHVPACVGASAYLVSRCAIVFVCYTAAAAVERAGRLLP
jgi:hypothetical protein